MTSLRSSRRLLGAVAVAAIATSACGVASIAPVVTEAERQFDPALVGSWVGQEDTTEYYVVAANKEKTGYDITWWAAGEADSYLTAELGMIGRHRVLDVVAVPRPEEGDVEKELTLRKHGIVVIRSVTPTELSVSFVEPDSLKAALKREPTITPNYLDSDHTLLTGSTAEVQRFLRMYLERPGALGEAGVLRRRRP